MAKSLRSLLLLDACHAGCDLIKLGTLSLDVIHLQALLCDDGFTRSIWNIRVHLNQTMALNKTENVAHLL